MQAALYKALRWAGGLLARYAYRYALDHVKAWLERRKIQKRTEALKKSYDEAVKNGDHKKIEETTESRLNG